MILERLKNLEAEKGPEGTLLNAASNVEKNSKLSNWSKKGAEHAKTLMNQAFTDPLTGYTGQEMLEDFDFIKAFRGETKIQEVEKETMKGFLTVSFMIVKRVTAGLLQLTKEGLSGKLNFARGFKIGAEIFDDKKGGKEK